MKIYNKVNFLSGLLHMLIGAIFLVDFYLERQVNSILLGSFALLLGLSSLFRSMRKELSQSSDEERRDAKSLEIRSKAREKALIIFQLILSLSLLLTIIYYLVSKNESVVPYIILSVFSIALIEFLESLIWNYYKKIN